MATEGAWLCDFETCKPRCLTIDFSLLPGENCGVADKNWGDWSPSGLRLTSISEFRRDASALRPGV